jgi:hypothetical protein
MRPLILFVVACACSGTSGVRDHAQQDVLATHCRDHACGPELRAEHLGDGCYAVDSRLYQCSSDTLPVGQLMCIDVTPCTGACKVTITVDDREVDIKRCRPKWQAYWHAKHPLTCSPVPVAVQGSFNAIPKTLDIPPDIVREVTRSGRDRLIYETAVCGLTSTTTVGDPIKSSGFPALDQWLAERLAGLDASSVRGSCTTVTLVLGRFECEVERESM